MEPAGDGAQRARWQWLLPRLAGRVPDDALAIMRTAVADDDPVEAALVLEELLSDGLALTGEEAAAGHDLLAADGKAPAAAEGAPRLDQLAAGPYEFLEPAGNRDPGRAAAAGEAVGGLQALWRVDRRSSVATAGVWLAEAAPASDLLELTAEIQHVLAEDGELPPRVEVFAEGADLPPYHVAALAAAMLVWAAPDQPEPRLARVFDGADPAAGPYFHHDHPCVDAAERDRLLAYLTRGQLVLDGFGSLDDVLDPAGAGAVPVGFRSDGRWVWTDTVSYYLQRHGLAPEPELRAHVLAAAGPPGPLSRLARHRALLALTPVEDDRA